MSFFITNKLSFGGLDVDAKAYIDAVGSMTSAQEGYIDTFVKALKTNGTWGNYDVIYIPLWEDATDNKWNLMNPTDSDGAFRASYTGTISHDSDGWTPGGTTSDYIDTHYIPKTSGNLTNTSANIAVYLQTIGGSLTGSRAYIMGANGASIVGMYGLAMFSSGSRNIGSIGGASGEYAPTGTSVETLGLMQVTNNGDRNSQHWKNGVKNGSTVAMTNTTANTTSIYIGNSNSDGSVQYPSDRTISMVLIGSGPTDTEVSDDYDAIQAFHTSMGINQ